MKFPILGKYLENRGQEQAAHALLDKYRIPSEYYRGLFSDFTKTCLKEGVSMPQIEFYLKHPVEHGEIFNERTWESVSVLEQILGRLYGLGEIAKDLNNRLKKGKISMSDHALFKSYIGTVEYHALAEASGLGNQLLRRISHTGNNT